MSRQCAEAVRKATNVLRLIKRHFFKLDKQTFLILYKCYVQPHLEYSVQAWSPSLQKDIVCMEQVQRRATKLVEGFKRLDYGTRLKELGLTTLEKLRVRGDLIETYKILTARERVKKEDFFSVTAEGVRSSRSSVFMRCSGVASISVHTSLANGQSNSGMLFLIT